MVHIQNLKSHSSCSGGENHTHTLNRKSGNLGSGSDFVPSQLGDFGRVFYISESLQLSSD